MCDSAERIFDGQVMKVKVAAKPILKLGIGVLFRPEDIHPHQPCLVRQCLVDATGGPVGMKRAGPVSVDELDDVLRRFCGRSPPRTRLRGRCSSRAPRIALAFPLGGDCV